MSSAQSSPGFMPIHLFYWTCALLESFLAPLTAALSQVLFKDSSPKSYKANLILRLIRALLSNVPVRNLQALSPQSEQAYRQFAREASLPENVVTLDDGSKAFWLGDENADTVLLYLHGGAYIVPATKGHFQLVSRAMSLAQQKGKSLRVFFLQYDLAPGAVYPAQLGQASTALSYLLTHTRPQNIILAGDSAGGNLALELLSHLKHPHPKVRPVELLTAPLAGVVLMSPWVTFDCTSRSFRTNAGKDCLDARSLKVCSAAFLNGAPVDAYNSPLAADPAWWADLCAAKVVMTAGGDEVFRDDILEFAQKIKVHNPNIEMYLAPAEPHTSPLLEMTTGLPYNLTGPMFLEGVVGAIS